MINEETVWSIFWVIAGIFLCTLCLTIKGCNETDDKLYAVAVSKGCSIRHYDSATQILCGNGSRTPDALSENVK